MKKIRRNLPFDHYKIVHSFSTEDLCICDNCGKVLKNVAVIENTKGTKYHVGVDCAETLSGITEYEIMETENDFNEAKRIRSKIRNAMKKGNYFLHIGNTYYDNNIYCQVTTVKDATCCGDFMVDEKIRSIDFLKRFLPELYAIAMVNFDFIEVPDEAHILAENNLTYKGYEFKYEYPVSKYGDRTCRVSIYENGVCLKTAGNCGRDFDAVNAEAVRLYNKIEFNKGLKKLELWNQFTKKD